MALFPRPIVLIPILAAVLASVGVFAAGGMAQEYQVHLQRENRARFVSDAPLEDFQGVTDRIDGFLYLAGEGLSSSSDLEESEFYFEVDLASLDTGIGLRNRHMRRNYLETDAHPFASYSGRVTRLEEVVEGGGFRASLSGVFTVHGVEREREIECTARPDRGDLHVQCGFQVSLPDHDIPIPKLMFMKIDEVMEVEVDFFLTPTGTDHRR